MPTSCCRRRASEPTISTVPTAPTGCMGPAGHYAGTALQLRRGPGIARRWARRPDLHARAADAARDFGATGRRPRRSGEAVRRQPIHIARLGRPALQTPSGPLDSTPIGLQAGPPMPDWNRDPLEAAEAAKWPLRLLTAPGYFHYTAFRAWASCAAARASRSACCIRRGAKTRGLRTATKVRLFNDRGASACADRRRDPARRRAGARPAPHSESVSGASTSLCSDRYTDMGEGATTRAPGSMWSRGGRGGAAAALGRVEPNSPRVAIRGLQEHRTLVGLLGQFGERLSNLRHGRAGQAKNVLISLRLSVDTYALLGSGRRVWSIFRAPALSGSRFNVKRDCFPCSRGPDKSMSIAAAASCWSNVL